MNKDDCEEAEECVNTIGGYDCRCKEGSSKVAGVCRESDECSLNQHSCDENATCMVICHRLLISSFDPQESQKFDLTKHKVKFQMS